MKERRISVLWIIPKWTFPIVDGARVATDGLLRNTACHNIDIDCLFVAPEEIKDPKSNLNKWNIREAFFIKRDLPSNKVLKVFFYLLKFLKNPLIPLTFSSFYDKKIRKEVLEKSQNKKYDIVLLDGLHLGACFLDGKSFSWPSQCKKVVYRSHNFEQELWFKGARKSNQFIIKPLLLFQAILVRLFENKLLKEVDHIASISLEDSEKMNSFLKENKKLSFVPLGLDFSKPLSLSKREEGRFLFIGRLDWPPNRDGLKWFLDNVWDEVVKKRKNAKLHIVGSGDSSWLQAYGEKEGLLIEGFIEDIDEAYELCEFSIMPIFYGSGTRIKVVESFAKGRPLISTKMGVQGADLDETKLLLAETKEEWVDLLSKVHLTKDIQENFEINRKKISLLFDEKEVGKNFYSSLLSLLPSVEG